MEKSEKFYFGLRVHTNRGSVSLTPESFNEINKAWDNLITILDIEESWQSIIENYIRFEKDVIEDALIHMVRDDYDYHKLQDSRLKFSVGLANLLGSCRFYLDHTASCLKRLVPYEDDADSFSRTRASAYDKCREYAFMEALRNYTQHRSLPIHSTSYNSSLSGQEDDYFFSYNITLKTFFHSLKKDRRFKTSVLDKFSEDEIDIQVAVRVYLENLSDIHLTLRENLKARFEDAKSVIFDIISIYKNESKKSNPIGTSLITVSDGQIVEKRPIIWELVERIDKLQFANRSLVNLSRRVLSTSRPWAF